MNAKHITTGAVARKFDGKYSLHILRVEGEMVKCLRSDGVTWTVRFSDMETPDYKLVRSAVAS